MGHINRTQLVIIVLFIAVFTTSRFFVSPQTPVEQVTPAETPKNPFAGISLEAEAAYVADAITGEILFAKNATTQLPLASITKVMTAVVASELAPRETIINISPEAIAKEGDTGLRTGERWRLADILDFTLIASSNDGAYAVASALNSLLELTVVSAEVPTASTDAHFIKRMNEKAAGIGMSETFFLNESGLDEHASLSGAYGSAKDMARLFTYALLNHPDILEATRYETLNIESLDAIAHEVENTNKRIGALPGIVASKTGFTDLAGGNLIIAFEAGPMRPIIVSVLGSSQDGRFDDVEKLVWASVEQIAVK
ncbi:MAG: hypothetical protein COW88_00520 [Candidatus Lloydbacteria bacterium CG22_combo_CG10-13_8_21_14_all_47_15]|uniref:Peptidase S11 D-alanyl-D-alanine carboxypeptidase A N-terminal domain-containing protein n=1 Tax=Candidatus Lloydbacteria bacterium CG22_combo_CG10-13_8_21_14_all_47_15 TaxID=1974635 RepID=A0A2H0CVH8_9BACT|nr:MAG: hypothetical protein COW88_00520 [Candidatus Lloydbacteria bacterium CG22_combo_CG10-13_8_21_14_all_47_15]